jgi:uncharacterized protein (DUF362 family)/NAD-dependent dihydropyrimidine dehydrogenase PreA subunit
MTRPDQENMVSVQKCGGYYYPDVKQAIIKMGKDILGGWETFIPSGAKILLKPNLLRPATAEQAVSPHPAVVRAVAEVCLDAGAGNIIIGDSPGYGTAQKVAAQCGILDVARDLGIKVIDFTESVSVPAPEDFLHRNFSIAREVAEADIIINLPKFKTHAMMTLTLAVKNLFGVFAGRQKARWHFQSGRNYNHFARLLMELAYTVKPAVSILDAITGMEGNGPGRGTPRAMGFLAASRDMVSLDRVAVEISGVNPERIYTLQAAREMGFNTDLEGIRVAGDSIAAVKIHDLKLAAHMAVEGPRFLRPLSWVVRRYATTRPSIDKSACKACGICMEACPAGSISQPAINEPVAISHETCISCFCCQELCPEGAITAKDALGVKLMQALGFG